MAGQDLFERRFKGGTWDLRREERRSVQATITFPDRRRDERRLTKMHDYYAPRMEDLNWIKKTGLDE